MNTPICEFVKSYEKKNSIRLHMPGHKGNGNLGVEKFDITEITGADSLYEANDIIKESEDNASSLFGFKTYYSTEGSSQCIRAMLYLACIKAIEQGKKPVVMAGRNVHKTFLGSVALLDFDVMWIYPDEEESYLSCNIDGKKLEEMFCNAKEKPTAVYVTSPDYLGNTADIKSLSEVCKKYGTLLLVDNAHGAYLKFLKESMHPIDLGADICCDSAHKTLPVITGGAYLHISEKFSESEENIKNAMALFGSTSPSYLILQSLDAVNKYIADGYSRKLNDFVLKTEELKRKLTEKGYTVCGNEPLKITIKTKDYGYKGTKLQKLLEEKNIICEFADPDYVVLMLTPQITEEELKFTEEALLSVPRKDAIADKPPKLFKAEKVISVREAVMSPREMTEVKNSAGKILADASVGCPPAVPIIVCGEKITKDVLEVFLYYGIEKINTVKNQK